MRIGKINWQIKLVNADSPILSGCMGICVYAENIIYLNKDLPEDAFRETVLHELTHALLAESSFNHKCKEHFQDYYEIFVDCLSKTIDDVVDFTLIEKELEL